MIKLNTPVDCHLEDIQISYSNKILVLGSCFADVTGSRLRNLGFDVCVNPFGTLYNPLSIKDALLRLDSGMPFTSDDCVEMGAGAGKICSFSHHTSFARGTAEEFLDAANASLVDACSFWRECDTVLITLGTSWVWEIDANGRVAANCLKRPASEFLRRRLAPAETLEALRELPLGSRRAVFTVSPIRHMSDGAHSNAVSKAGLLVALDEYLSSASDGPRTYFPAYEIVLDELRDYRFYADDLVHPSSLAQSIIWERFCDVFIPSSEHVRMKEEEKRYRQSLHRTML